MPLRQPLCSGDLLRCGDTVLAVSLPGERRAAVSPRAETRPVIG